MIVNRYERKIDVITYKSFKSKSNCKVYSLAANSQPNFISYETCDGKLESMVISKEIKICAKKIISLSPEISIIES